MLSKIRHYVPKEELKSIYHAIFSSHLIYGCQIWGQGHNAHINKIYKLQNRALRIINFEGFRADSNPLYVNNGILKLNDYIKMQNCLFVYDYLNNMLPKIFEDYYFKLNYLYFNIQTRNAKLCCLFSPSKNTTKYGLNSITQQSIYTWNSITKNLGKDLSSFSRYQLKDLLIQHYMSKY